MHRHELTTGRTFGVNFEHGEDFVPPSPSSAAPTASATATSRCSWPGSPRLVFGRDPGLSVARAGPAQRARVVLLAAGACPPRRSIGGRYEAGGIEASLTCRGRG